MIDKPKIVKDFQYKGRRCVVVFIDRSEMRKITKVGLMGSDYHNGYIEIQESELKDEDYDYDLSEEITYCGDLSHIEKPTTKTYIGFDTAHYYNYENPKTQSLEYVENQCKKIVDELNANDVLECIKTSNSVNAKTNKDLTDFQKENPKSATQTSLNPDIKRNLRYRLAGN